MTGRNGLAGRIGRLEAGAPHRGGCAVCGDRRMIVLRPDEEARERFVGDACRGCGLPTKLYRNIDLALL